MIWSALDLFVRTILYGWVISLLELLKMLCRRRPPKTPGEHRPTQSGCVRIDHPAFVRPDPLIYSQKYLRAQGLAVTYNNPDITLFKAGVPVSSSAIDASTTYEVRARIWNSSTEAPVIHMPVHLSFRTFGIGNETVPVTSTHVDVGVLGSPNQPAFATMLWTTPPTTGHYCLLVQLDPYDDSNPANNLGQENTNVIAATSPAVFEFKLSNDTQQRRQYRFEVDAYQIPELPKCGDVKPDKDAMLRIHRPEMHPVPAGFAVQIEPRTPALDPAESVLITVTVDPPAGFIGQQTINVNALHEQGLAGGVTLTTVKEV